MRLIRASGWWPFAVGLFLSGCVSGEQVALYSAIDAGFYQVAGAADEATGKAVVWVQDRQTAERLAEQVHGLLHKKTISADTAVQVALLNNKGLQAAYAEIGISAAEVWQQTMLPNPKVSIGVFGIAAPGLGAWRTIEGMIANNILAMTTMQRRVGIADAQFRKAQLNAILATLRVAANARRAWINSVGAFETVFYLNQAQQAADAASELALRLGETGALAKSGQAREHAFYSELTGQRAKARLAANLKKENLTRVMGIWGSDVDYFVPDQLPDLPKRIAAKPTIEAEALFRRVDLQIAKLELEATALSYGLTEATLFVTDFEILAGFEVEREVETESVPGSAEPIHKIKTITTPQVEFEFVIPIFDSGEARLRKAELAYMRAANLLAEKAVNIRSEARSAYTAYRGTNDIAVHYQRNVLPLRVTIEEEALLSYNGMITNTFELLADTRAKINTILLATVAKQDFWLADANLSAAIYGGGSTDEVSEAPAALAEDNAGGH